MHQPTDIEMDKLAILKSIRALQGMSTDRLIKLSTSVQLVELVPGEALIRQGEKGDSMYFLATGKLDVRVRMGTEERSVATIHPGEPIGEIQLLVGGIRTASVYALEPCSVVRLTGDTLRKWEHDHDDIEASLLEVIRDRQRRNELLRILTFYLGEMDTESMDWLVNHAGWVRLQRGDALFRQGDSGKSWYVLVEGQMEVQVSTAEGVRRVGTIERGGSVGEAALIVDKPRSATIVATRDCELIEVNEEAFTYLRDRFPQFTEALLKLMVERLSAVGTPRAAPHAKLVAVRRYGNAIPLPDLTRALAESLGGWGNVKHLSTAHLRTELDVPEGALDNRHHPAWHRIRVILNHLEQSASFIMLEVDDPHSAWGHFCINQADEYVEFARAGDTPPQASALPESGLRTLVLLQPADSSLPSGTGAWLKALRPHRHLHIREGQERLDGVARWVAGKAVGLVLGGGGARGFAHIGVWQALVEAGIPIDAIGGTSMGSIMSANIAMGRSHEEIIKIQRKGIARKPFKRYTFPIMSLIEAAPIDSVARMAFGDTQIEDLWLPYFCVSADLTTARPMVHRDGAVWKATRASGALPVITMPVLHEGHLLVDGGVFNNLPGDVMRELGVGYVIAVNVSPDDEMHVSLDELPTNRELFWQRWFGRQSRPSLPKLGDILVRTMVLSSQQKLEEVTASADLLLKVPVEPYGMLQFEAIDELVQRGYEFTVEQLDQGAGKELPRVTPG